ncbi:MAG: hypothetical protein ACFNYB_03795 [Campylobacter sp.]
MEILNRILGEILAFAAVFALAFFYASRRAKKADGDFGSRDYERNLRNFAEIFGLNSDDERNFAQILNALSEEGKILKFSKNCSGGELIKILGERNLKSEFAARNFDGKRADAAFLSEISRNLNEPSALGVYVIGDEIFAFLREKEELLKIVDAAAGAGENILICD